MSFNFLSPGTHRRMPLSGALILAALIWLLAGGARHVQAQNASDKAVQVSATVSTTPAPQIVLTWPADPNATSYQVYRKGRDDTSWGNAVATLPGIATGYTDLLVTDGTAYEYQILCADSKVFQATGYIYSGINVPLTDSRGTVILVVDNTMSAPLSQELAQLQQDLIGDGWAVIRHDVGRDQNLSDNYQGAPAPVREPNDKGAGAAALKALIVADYNADPTHVKAVFLFGHVPIAFSGDIAPDGHGNHVGPWPADVYYGDVAGTWTDTTDFTDTHNSTNTYDPNSTLTAANTPNDGNFDQSTIPAPVTLAVGRVDLYAMPAYAPKTETDLLRQYLNKDHAFRVAQLVEQRRGITDSRFGYFYGEAFQANAYRNFPPFFGQSQITDISSDPISWLPTLDKNSYLWGEADSGGAPNGIQDIVNVGLGDGSTGINDGQPSDDYALHTPKAVFNMLFGSFLGDWTFGYYYQQTTFSGAGSSNNLLRAALANGDGLTDVWAGRPNWFFHHMALGETIGFSTLITQNNGFSNLYQPQNVGTGEIHIALMGDPTLRMHMVVPATKLKAPVAGSADLQWTASTDSNIVGYHVYRAATAAGPYTRLTMAPVTGTTYTDTTATPGTYSYMVRAVKLETSGSGTYFNPSEGAFLNVTVTQLALTSVSINPSTIQEGTTATGTVTLSQSAPAGGIVVSLSSSDPSASVPTNVTVAQGDRTATFTVTPSAVTQSITDTITASYNSVSKTATVTVQPLTVASVAFAPASVFEGSDSTGTVTLNGPAPAGGVSVSLSSDNAAVPVAATVSVAGGATTASVTVTTGMVSTATTANVTASLNGASQSGTLTVTPIRVSSLTLAPSSVFGGGSSTATVTLTGPAPTGGAVIALSSSDPSASVPASVTIAQGDKTATFTVTTQVVSAQTTANIGAAFRGASQTAALTVQPYAVTGLTLNPTSVVAGSASTATVTLNSPAPAGGLTVSVSSDNAAVAVPATIQVPAGQGTITFNATTQAVTSATTAHLSASLPSGAQSASLSVSVNGLVSLSLDPSTAASGSLVTGTVALSGPAPAGGAVVSLTSAVPSLAPAPASVTVPAGQASASFTFTAGAAVGTATVRLTASESGTSQGATLTVQGVTLKSLSFAPSQVRAGQPSAGTVTLSGPAPAGGATVTLTSGNKAVAVPATVTVPGGAASATFTTSTSAVSSAITVGVTASAGGSQAQGQLTVTPVPGTVFGSGIRMISVPMDYPGVPFDQVLGAGVTLYRWMPSALMYAISPSAPANEVRLGRGYWLRSPGGVTVSRQGTPADTTRDFTIGLEKGWNQIGDPFFSSVPLSSLRVSSGGAAVGLGQAGSAIDSPLYVYNPPAGGAPGQYQVAGSLDPGQGYWVHATAPTTLTVPHP